MSKDMNQEKVRGPVIEVEVERLPAGGGVASEDDLGARGPSDQVREITAVIGPVLAGLLIDVLDAVTVAPPLGLALGWPLGYYILRQAGVAPAKALRWGILVGVYCAIPMTMLLPIGTLMGVGVRVQQVLARHKSRS